MDWVRVSMVMWECLGEEALTFVVGEGRGAGGGSFCWSGDLEEEACCRTGDSATASSAERG